MPLRSDWHEHMKKHEARFSADAYAGLQPAGSVEYHQGTTGILLTAAHATNHMREAKLKWADLWTGSLAILLAEATGASYLISTGVLTDWLPWSERKDGFAEALNASSERFCIDLHGMSDNHGFDVALGLGVAPSSQTLAAAKTLQQALTPYSTSTTSRFSARSPLTVTAHMQQTRQISAFQMEIRAGLRYPTATEPKAFEKFIPKLADALAQLS